MILFNYSPVGRQYAGINSVDVSKTEGGQTFLFAPNVSVLLVLLHSGVLPYFGHSLTHTELYIVVGESVL